MRQLFVPACLSVITWSNTTGFDLPIDKFSGSASFERKVLVRAAKSASGALDEPPPAEPNEEAAGATDASAAAQDEAAAVETPSAEDAAVVAAVVPTESVVELRPAIDPH